MADDRDRNQGMKQGDVGGGAGQQGGQSQEAPGRNPGQGQQTGGHQGDAGKQPDGQNRGTDQGIKDGGQNEETRR
ncbi:MAG TPA: hypothetical protein VE961_19370 [Pyrinomonadaceae bacterium]|nr:hypothetical protein [Pyrinomonadaceae bacterium]